MTRAAVCLLVCLAASALAQQQVLSPRDSVVLALDSASVISVDYGRPSMRGRAIMGGLLPWGKIWRTGANLATHLHTTFDMTLGGMPIPRGTYTIYSIPDPVHWTVIVNNQTGQWGTQYDPRQDRARITVAPRTLTSPIDTFRVSLAPGGRSAGTLRLAWERTVLEIPFERNDRIHPVSPLDSTSVVLAGRNVKIRYSRPFIRGRDIWGTLVPYDSVWRTGANAPTTLVTEGEIRIGGVSIPRGSYSLYTVPNDNGMVLMVNRRTPGPEPQYQASLDIARIPMRMSRPTTPIDPLSIRLTPASSASCTLTIGWADRLFSVPVTLR
jgi:hypothetical protein